MKKHPELLISLDATKLAYETTENPAYLDAFYFIRNILNERIG
jgi:hypothetical protein